MATLNGNPCSRLTLSLPYFGAWYCDVILEGGALPSGIVTLQTGTLTLVGTVARANYDTPDKPHAVVVGSVGNVGSNGAIGWEAETLASYSLQSAGGVLLSAILKDLAVANGETVVAPSPDAVVGQAFSYPQSSPGQSYRYRNALAALHRANVCSPWWIDPATCATRFDARPSGVVTTRATNMSRDSGEGATTYGVDDPAQFMPGALLGGQAILRSVVLETTAEIVVTVWQ